MFNSRWRKIMGDLFIHKMRTLFVILAMSIGTFGISVVANSYAILMREMDTNYMNTTPASATLHTDSLSDSYIQKIRDLPYIKDAEEREKIVGRVQIGESEWKDIWLFVVNDFNDVRLDTFTSEKGKAVPETGEILFERKALLIAKTEIGGSVNIKIPDGNKTSLKLTGTVHASGLAPAWMEGFAYGYISPDTLQLLGGTSHNTELKILVAEDEMNKKHIKDTVYQLKDYIQKDGFKVSSIEIPEPGKHTHYDQMATLLFLMEIFGLLALVLSGVLVANMITAILKQQTRQIGIMKAIGASSLQITGLYQGMVLILAFIAMSISFPISIFGGRSYALLAAGILNFNIYSYNVPLYVFIFELAVSFLVPLLAAAFPIIKGSKITVREAINDYGISQDKYSGKQMTAPSKMLEFLPRPFLLSLRNTFRCKARLIFTMLVMAIGGTSFIVAMNIYGSMYNTVDKKIDTISYDIQVTLGHAEPAKNIADALSEIPGVKKAEAWSGANASRLYNDGTFGESFNIIAPPASTTLMSASPLYAGRWLRTDDKNALVINQKLLSHEPDIKVGDEISLTINQLDTKWKVVGISKELIGSPLAYVNSEYLNELTKQQGLAVNAVILTDNRSASSQSNVAKLLEEKMEDNGIPIASLNKIADYRKAIEDHLLLIAVFLIIMSVLVVIVGGLGLATSISVNVLERTREIGIMRAIGASTYSLTATIITEGMIIGIISWIVSLALSWPLSKFASYQFGMIFFGSPLEFAVSGLGFIIWLMLVIIFGALASFYPAYKASKMSISNALSYE